MLPADGSSTVAKIAADLRPSAEESAVHTSLVVGCGQAAGNQRVYSLQATAPWDRQTDGHADESRYRIMLPYRRAEA